MKFIDSLKIPQIAPSFGGPESLIEQPALMSFMDITKEEREKLREVIEKIKTSKFEATPGFPFPCSWCDYKQVCPFAKKS